MLINDFCKVQNLGYQVDAIKATLQWNSCHTIFAGHFPGQPIVPGVCMMQIIKELLEFQIDEKIVLKESGMMKFLQFIDPLVNHEVEIQINYTIKEDGAINVSAFLKNDKAIFFKFVGVYVLFKKNNKGI